jgi:hypothetical protein
MAAQAQAHPTDNDTAGRKIAQPKGKVGRFSDVHMAAFKKMDSIANHASAWRTDLNRNKPVDKHSTSLKRSPSKAELDSSVKPPASNLLKRSPSKAGLNVSSERSPQKLDATRIPNTQQASAYSSKRVKHATTDDATTFRPKSREGNTSSSTLAAPKTSQSIRSKLLTPTKSSIARSQSTSNLRATGIPSIVRSKSSKDLRNVPSNSVKVRSVAELYSPSPVRTKALLDTPINMASLTPTHKSGIKAPMNIKSILRTPRHLYSNDPSKIAAGTHISTPPDLKNIKPRAPSTAPVTKHVNFSASTQLKALKDEMKAASVEPEPLYPILAKAELESADRRMSLSDLPMPGAFTFRAGTDMKFGDMPLTSTIRPVRESDTGLAPSTVRTLFPRKRKADAILGSVDETSEDKENEEVIEAEEPPSKKMRVTPKSAPVLSSPKKSMIKSRLPALKGVVKKGLSASRLNFLSMPKKRAGA